MNATRRETRLWLAIFIALLLVYLAWPDIDLPVSALFYHAETGFWIDDQRWVRIVH